MDREDGARFEAIAHVVVTYFNVFGGFVEDRVTSKFDRGFVINLESGSIWLLLLEFGKELS